MYEKRNVMGVGKVKYRDLSNRDKKKLLGDLYSMFSLLKGREETKNFLKDILTLSETIMIARRIQIAKMLLLGKTQQEIIEKMKVGQATIVNVDKWLNEGFGGYREAIKKYNKYQKRHRKNKEISGTMPPSFDYLRKKYPAHFALFNAILDD